MYQIIENGKVIHESNNMEAAHWWAFILKYTQGRTVSIKFGPKH